MQIGERAELTRRFTALDLAEFAQLTGTAVPLTHLPDALIGGLFSCLLGTKLPGPGTGWLKQELDHLARAQVDEVLTAEVEVIRLRPEKNLVDLMCLCTGNQRRLLCRGRALMLLPKPPALQC